MELGPAPLLGVRSAPQSDKRSIPSFFPNPSLSCIPDASSLFSTFPQTFFLFLVRLLLLHLLKTKLFLTLCRNALFQQRSTRWNQFLLPLRECSACPSVLALMLCLMWGTFGSTAGLYVPRKQRLSHLCNSDSAQPTALHRKARFPRALIVVHGSQRRGVLMLFILLY